VRVSEPQIVICTTTPHPRFREAVTPPLSGFPIFPIFVAFHVAAAAQYPLYLSLSNRFEVTIHNCKPPSRVASIRDLLTGTDSAQRADMQRLRFL
jgi:hypothetical protein